MAEYGKKTLNDALRYGRLSSAYSGAPAVGKGYGMPDSYGTPRGGDGAAADDYMGIFMRAAGTMYGAVRGMQDSQRGPALGNYGPARGGAYGAYDEQCAFPDCPHHGVQKGAQYGGLERRMSKGYNDSYGNNRK